MPKLKAMPYMGKQYEHKVVQFDDKDMFGATGGCPMEGRLCELGKDGWCVADSSTYGSYLFVTLVREVVE
jgi:hypothetical protein